MYDVFPDVYSSEYFTNTAKFVYVAVNIKTDAIVEVLAFFYTLRIINVVVIGSFNGTFEAFSYNPFFMKPGNNYYSLDNSSAKLGEVFPDKLRNLNGYEYKLIFFQNFPRLFMINGWIHGPEFLFMENVANVQNAKLEVFKVTSNANSVISDSLNNRKVDICLNTDLYITSQKAHKIKYVITWDTDGFCAIVPHPEIERHFDFIYKPFDLWAWILIIIIMFCGATVWHFLNQHSRFKSNSPGFFIFGFISNFLGQSVAFRQHRLTQKIVLQLTIIMTFVLGTAYQSVFISMMCDSQYGIKISSLDALINRDYSFYVSKHFVNQLNGSEYYQKMSAKIINHLDHLNMNYKQLSLDNIAIIERCSLLDDILNNGERYFEKYRLPRLFYYKLDEQFNSFYLKFPTAVNSFFHQRLEEFSLKLFESGIKKNLDCQTPNCRPLSN